MSATDAQVFPPRNAAARIPVRFVDTSGNLITGWTGAASKVSVDAAAVVTGGTPTEIGTNGIGYLDLTAAQMNGQLIEIVCSITNTNATAFVSAVYTTPVLTSGTRPAFPAGWLDMLHWLFLYFYGTNQWQRSPGLQTIENDDGSTLTTIQTVGSDVQFSKFKSTP